jgi:hypothetical protein
MTNQDYDSRIIAALDRRKDDPVALTQFAVNAINHIDDVSLVSKNTRDKLFDAFLADSDTYSRRRILTRNLLENECEFEDITTDELKTAYCKIIDAYNFSEKFQTHLKTELMSVFGKAKFDRDWDQATLIQKLEYIHTLCETFLDRFDPEKDIHSEEPFNAPSVIALSTRELLPGESFTPACFFKQDSSIHVCRFLTVYKTIPGMDPTDCGFDYEAIDSLYHDQNFDLAQMEFDNDKSHSDLEAIFHHQYNHKTPHIRFLTNVKNESETMALIAHELCHLIIFRLMVLSSVNAAYTEEQFNFSERDRRFTEINYAAYENMENKDDPEKARVNEILYTRNKEEVLAYEIQDSVLKARQAPSGAAP